MITGLLFTLAQKNPVAANDTSTEGRHFPPKPPKRVKAPIKAPVNVVRLTQVVSVFLAVLGVGLLGLSTLNWSFDPASGLNLQTAGLHFTLPMGVLS
jgi:hypothetical protein